MRRGKNGRWMLAMLVLASLVVPGIVAARQQPSDPVPAVSAPDEDPSLDLAQGGVTDGDVNAAVGPTCFNRVCTTNAQCRLWCDDGGAACRPSASPPHTKFCILQ